MRPTRRSGAVLVCVLVVLLIVGLLSAQTIQTLLIVRRGDGERRQLRQARELVGLGRIVLRQQAAHLPTEKITVVVDDPSAASGEASSLGVIELTLPEGAGLSSEDSSRVRIVATYPVGSAGAVTTTWESEE